jgi:toxin YoeB
MRLARFTVVTPHGWGDYTYWLGADRATLKRINRLIDDALRDPTAGVGKPEPLRHMLAGVWSRRISEEHRLVPLCDCSVIADRSDGSAPQGSGLVALPRFATTPSLAGALLPVHLVRAGSCADTVAAG